MRSMLVMDDDAAAGWPVREQQQRRNVSLGALEADRALDVAVARPLLGADQRRLLRRREGEPAGQVGAQVDDG
jgi:hypothetical protein